jgi:hypothetical protein
MESYAQRQALRFRGFYLFNRVLVLNATNSGCSPSLPSAYFPVREGMRSDGTDTCVTLSHSTTCLDWVTGLELQYFFDVNRPTVIISQTQLVYNPAVEQPSLMRSKQYSVSAAHNRLETVDGRGALDL